MYCRKNLIVTKENIKDKIIAIKFSNEKFIFSVWIKLFRPNIVTAPKVGIESKKDILAESNLLKFNILDAVIVIPDLLTPGINDKTCKIPMKITDLNEKSLSNCLFTLNLSLMYNKIPNIMVVQPIIFMLLSWSIKPYLMRKYPKNIIGNEEIIIFKNKSLFFA